MADILIRAVDPETKAKLKVRAARHGHSLSAEIRGILQSEAARPEPEAAPSEGFGTHWAKRFDEVGLTETEWELFQKGGDEARKQPTRPPPDFSE